MQKYLLGVLPHLYSEPDQNLSFELSDILILLCAVCFAIHILVIDHFAPYVDGVRLSCMQFLICGILTVLPMIFFVFVFSHCCFIKIGLLVLNIANSSHKGF